MIVTRSKSNCSPKHQYRSVHAKTPAMNVYTAGDEYIFEFSLAGVTKDQLSIKVENHVLVLDVSKNSKEDTKEQLYSRRVRLPQDADHSHNDAKLENGILRISIAKKIKETVNINIA